MPLYNIRQIEGAIAARLLEGKVAALIHRGLPYNGSRQSEGMESPSDESFVFEIYGRVLGTRVFC